MKGMMRGMMRSNLPLSLLPRAKNGRLRKPEQRPEQRPEAIKKSRKRKILSLEGFKLQFKTT